MELEIVAADGRRCRALHGAVVGRDPTSALVIEGERVSRQHFVIELAGERVVLRDLRSRNGTRVNGRAVGTATLRAGDRIEAGDVLLEVREVETDRPSREPGEVRVWLRAGEERFTLDPGPWAQTQSDAGQAPDAPLVARFEALYRGALVVARARTEEDVAEQFLAIASTLFGASGGVVTLGAEAPRVLATRGDAADVALAQRALSEGASFVAATAEGHALAALLKTQSERLGAIILCIPSRSTSGSADSLQLLVAIAHQCALTLEALRLRQRLQVENEALRARLAREGATGPLLGVSAPMNRLRELLDRVARTDTTVLVRGESGTGKELVAEALHAASPRASGPFVAVNCGALVDTLVASELFGHERGAFTGAERRKPGMFERARGGTLFLDELGELPPDVQVRLLRVLETRRVVRVGGTDEIPVDVRLVAATHRDLDAMVASGAFREDLYYRVQVFTLEVPPLRERREDVPQLAAHLLELLAKRAGVPAPRLTADALERLASHAWPGNVRELRNVLERALILARGERIEADDLGRLGRAKTDAPPATATATPALRLEDVEAAHVRRVLRSVGWNKTRAAELLGITRQTVHDKIRQHGLAPDGDQGDG